MFNDGVEGMAVAYLHDILENTRVTEEDLREARIPEKLITTLVILTRNDGEKYVDYLARIKKDPLAKKVKIADMLHNLSDDPTERQIIKYAKGLLFLMDG